MSILEIKKLSCRAYGRTPYSPNQKCKKFCFVPYFNKKRNEKEKWKREKCMSDNVPQYAMFTGGIISCEARYRQWIWAEAFVKSRSRILRVIWCTCFSFNSWKELLLKKSSFVFLFGAEGRGEVKSVILPLNDIIPGKSCTLIITPWEFNPLRKYMMYSFGHHSF